MKIFIGSTFEDLKNHRKRTIESLKGFKIYIEAMELWYAKPSDPVATSLELVKHSDVYICIVAHRYGSTTESGKSITQTEYECAQDEGIDCLIFIMNEEYPVLPCYMDRDITGEKLDKFKKKLLKNHVCAFFSSPEDLAHKVVKSVRNLMKFKGIKEAEKINLEQFWEEMRSTWLGLEPEDLRMEFNTKDSIFVLIEKLNKQIEGIQTFHTYISSSYNRLTEDLENLLIKIGCGPNNLKTIPYYENPFVSRDWEWITLFPNRLTACRIAIAQLRVKGLELISETSEWNEDLAKDLKKAKKEFEDAIKNGIYID